uniref:Core-2/I-branching enzyme n=1 Tax=Megaviridae environmental sample TaxID=1737588 RepID=A0A5J6VKT9_9VIRU|nr:MAG: core-2/I-branching enzyme [Megaviridae environmental sample]
MFKNINNLDKKIALCFLTYDNLSKVNVWKNFLNSKYNFYIHNKNDFEGDMSKFCIKDRVPTKWGDLSLVVATLNLFKEAYENSDNEYFILLSDKCIPILHPDKLYNKVKTIDQNIISIQRKKILNIENRLRYRSLNQKYFFDKDNFKKQSQWCILKRKTVQFFIENDFTEIFGVSAIIPDEHYFINLMEKYSIPYVDRVVTFDNWRDPSEVSHDKYGNKVRHKPKTYFNLNNNDVIKALTTGAFFMRKIDKDALLSVYFNNFSFINSTDIFQYENFLSKSNIDYCNYLNITNFHKSDYPKIVVIAGVHGDEYGPVYGVEKFIELYKDLFKVGNIYFIPRVNYIGIKQNVRNLPCKEGYYDINRNFYDSNNSYIEKTIMNLIKNSDFILDFHEGYDFHKKNNNSVGSTILPVINEHSMNIAQLLVDNLNKKIKISSKKFTVLTESHFNIKNTLRDYCNTKNLNYNLVEITGQKNAQHIDIRIEQTINVLNSLFNYYSIL